MTSNPESLRLHIHHAIEDVVSELTEDEVKAARLREALTDLVATTLDLVRLEQVLVGGK